MDARELPHGESSGVSGHGDLGRECIYLGISSQSAVIATKEDERGEGCTPPLVSCVRERRLRLATLGCLGSDEASAVQ